MKTRITKIVDDILNQGYCVYPNFLSHFTTKPLKEALVKKNMTPAGIGQYKDKNIEIRSDNIYWLCEQDIEPPIINFLKYIDDIKQQFNFELMLGLQSFEAHFAQYPEGSFYKPHIDSTKKNNSRVLTFITYLNDEWEKGDGGELRIHHNNSMIDVEPHMGTIVCFQSDIILHEVLKANKPRCAITGWLHNSSRKSY